MENISTNTTAGPQDNHSLQEERMERAQKVINRLEAMSKQGESYDDKGRHGWRNPVRADTGTILQALVTARKPKRVLEIGTAYGLSGCYLASTLPEGSEMISIEWDEAVSKEAQANFDEAGLPVTVFHGDAMKVIAELDKSGQFDLVFMDANKDGYYEQLRLLEETGLLAPDALIVADNVTDRASEMPDFLEYLKDRSVTVPTECGLLVARI
jgi:predicted O-methyltransferase YrrM